MAQAAAETRRSEPIKPIASPLHLLLVLLIIGFWAYRGAVNSERAIQSLSANRPFYYLRTIAFEWAMLGVVLIGLRLRGSSYLTVLGERWRSRKELTRDIGIAAVFWIVSTIVLSAIAPHSHSATPNPLVHAILPNGLLESTLWIVLSISAGICEEAVDRGYLQHQFMAMTRNVPIGIALAALVFGLGHSYKGWAGAAGVFVDGVMLGTLAYWRRSLRPGMMAHAFTDVFAGVLARLLKVGVS